MNIDAGHLWIVPVIAVLVGLLRSIPAIDSRPWCLPWLSIAVGMALAALALVLAPPPDVTFARYLATWIVTGLTGGLTSSGLYSAGGKAAIDPITRAFIK